MVEYTNEMASISLASSNSRPRSVQALCCTDVLFTAIKVEQVTTQFHHILVAIWHMVFFACHTRSDGHLRSAACIQFPNLPLSLFFLSRKRAKVNDDPAAGIVHLTPSSLFSTIASKKALEEFHEVQTSIQTWRID